MSTDKGIFIVLEGADGSGKSTQFKLLKERLRAVGYEVEVFDFPRYHKSSSHFVQRYLNGDYGPAKAVSPYTAALFFALDRYEAAPAIRKALNEGKIVIADRYVGSNMAHQGGKFSDSVQQRGFFVWEDSLEFQMLGIPRPNFNFFLRVPAEIAYKQIAKMGKNADGTSRPDEHEKDLNHLKNAVATYDTLCRLFPKDFQAIECTKDGKILSVADVNDKIWEKLKPVLPKPSHKARDVVFSLKDQVNALETKAESDHQTAPNESSINLTGDKITININKVSLLALSSVQIFPGITAEINSILWPQDGNYNFYTPAGLPAKVNTLYKESMQKQINWHRQMAKVAKTNQDLITDLKACVPLAALASAKISGPAEQIGRLVAELEYNPLTEVRWLAQQLRAAGQKIRPQGFKIFAQSGSNTNAPEVLKAAGDAIAKLVNEHLPQTLSPNTEEVSLLEAHPRNEFDLLAESLYSYSTSSLMDIKAELEHWSYEQKRKALLTAAQAPNGKLLREVNYLWNIICDRQAFNDLQKSLSVKEVKSQPATPRYGYNVPESIETASIDEPFIACFDESLRLFSSLQAAEHEDVAGYATLLGHKTRWQFTTTAQDLKTARQTANPEVSLLIQTIKEKIEQNHPLLGEFMRNANNPKPDVKKENIKINDPPKKALPKNRRRTKKPKK